MIAAYFRPVDLTKKENLQDWYLKVTQIGIHPLANVNLFQFYQSIALIVEPPALRPHSG